MKIGMANFSKVKENLNQKLKIGVICFNDGVENVDFVECFVYARLECLKLSNSCTKDELRS